MNRLEKHLESQFKVENDDMGIPSIIVVDGKVQSLVQSIDRKQMLFAMKKYLLGMLALQEDMASKIANDYLDRKYKEYMDYVLNL
jgi:hypothetical protein